MNPTFEQLVALCDAAKQPFQALVRKREGTYQVSVRNKAATSSENAFICDYGDTPTQALANIIKKHRIGHPTIQPSLEEEDPLS